jgi:HK97 family phage portal protein
MKIAEAFRWAVSGIKAGQALEKSAASALADHLFRLGFDAYPPTSSVDPFSDHPTAYRAIQAFARNVAAMPFELFTKGSDEPVENTPINRLFDRPNPLMRGTQLFEALTIDLECYGNGLWWLGAPARVNGAGLILPSNIRRLDPNKVTIKLGPGDTPVLYLFSAPGQQLKIPAEEVLHFKYWNPNDETWGMSWVGPARGEIEADAQASRWNRQFFIRGAEPGFILVPEGDMNISESSAERIRQSWINRHAGVEKSHAPAIMPKGLKAEKTGIGQKDMDFVQGRRFSRENTLSTAGVPPAIAGILEYANYANMMPQLRIFFHLELLPRLAYIEDVIQTDLLDRFKTGLEGHFKVEAIMALADEIGTKSEVAVRLSSIGVPLTLINERLELGLNLDGVAGADQPVNAPAAPGQPTAVPGHGGAPAAPEPPPPAPAQAESLVVMPRAWRSTELDAIWRRLVNHVHDLELQAESRWRTHLRNLRDESIRNVGAAFKAFSGAITRVDEQQKGPPIFDLQNADQEAILAFEPIWRASMTRGVDSIAGQTGAAVDFHFTDPRVVQLLAGRRQEIRGVDERMLTDLHELLQEGLAERNTEEELKRLVIDFFGGERANARTVARTETFSAYSGGRFEAMREARVRTHRWVTARDARVRDEHIVLEGERVMVGAPFSNGLEYPHDPTGEAGQVINCRCVTIPEVA